MAKPANPSQGSEWLPIPEGMWRVVIGTPRIAERTSQWGTHDELTFPLELTESEQARLKAEHGEPPAGFQQSYRLWVRGKESSACGFYKKGSYQQTDCGPAQLMCAAVGAKHSKTLREWMAAGGVPPLSPNQTKDQEWAELLSWYGWFENLEVWITVRHDRGKSDPNVIYPRVASILPVGSLPGQPEPLYQQQTANKVRTMISIAGGTVAEPEAPADPVDEEAELAARLAAIQAKKSAAGSAGVPARSYEEVFEADKLPV